MAEKEVLTLYAKLQLDMITYEITNDIINILGSKLHKIILYGSYARGDNDSESDIDMMILANLRNDEMSTFRKKINKVASKVGLEHDIMISISLRDKNFFDEYKNVLPFYRNISMEGIELYGSQ